VAGRWFAAGTPVSSTNKTDCHYITDILFKVVLSTIKPQKTVNVSYQISTSINRLKNN